MHLLTSNTMWQVKSVFVDGMPSTWEEEKIREHFGKFGEIERVVLARNMLAAKRKDFGFVNYVERDAALACIDALNNTEIIDGDVKVRHPSVLSQLKFQVRLLDRPSFVPSLTGVFSTVKGEGGAREATGQKQVWKGDKGRIPSRVPRRPSSGNKSWPCWKSMQWNGNTV